MPKTLTITKTITKTKKDETVEAKSVLDDIIEKTERGNSNKVQSHKRKSKRLKVSK